MRSGERSNVAGLPMSCNSVPPPERQRHRRVLQLVEHDERVRPHIAFRVVLRRLLDALQRRNLRQNHFQQSRFIQQLETASRPALAENAADLVANPLDRDLVDRGRLFVDRLERRGLDLEPEPRSEADSPQHPQLVFREPFVGIADRSNPAIRQIGVAFDIVQILLPDRVEENAVDREVAPANVLLRVPRERHTLGAPPVAVVVVRTESRYLHVHAVPVNQYHAELRSNADSVREILQQVLRRRVGGDVVVLCGNAEQAITHAPARPVGLMTV